MKIFFLALSLLPWISYSKEVFSDKAVFRVAEEIVFLSDLKETGESLEKLRCLKTDGLMLSLLELDKKSQKKIPDFKNFDFKDQSNKDFIQKIILFKKAGHFIDTQNVVFDPGFKSQIENHSCIKMKYSDWSRDLKRFFDLELYTQKRYMAAKARKEKRSDEALLASAKLFLASLSQKINHYVFY